MTVCDELLVKKWRYDLEQNRHGALAALAKKIRDRNMTDEEILSVIRQFEEIYPGIVDSIFRK